MPVILLSRELYRRSVKAGEKRKAVVGGKCPFVQTITPHPPPEGSIRPFVTSRKPNISIENLCKRKLLSGQDPVVTGLALHYSLVSPPPIDLALVRLRLVLPDLDVHRQ